jgi:hypothetical protein
VLIESFLRLAKSRELERMSEIWSIHLLFRKQISKALKKSGVALRIARDFFSTVCEIRLSFSPVSSRSFQGNSF